MSGIPGPGVSLEDVLIRGNFTSPADQALESRIPLWRFWRRRQGLHRRRIMWQELRNRIFGGSARIPPAMPAIDPTVLIKALTSADLERKPWRTVGITEQRLREKNRRSWVTSSKGWSEMLGRFSKSGS